MEDLQSVSFGMCVQVNIHKYIFICYSQFKYILFSIIYPPMYLYQNMYFFSITCSKDVVFLLSL